MGTVDGGEGDGGCWGVFDGDGWSYATDGGGDRRGEEGEGGCVEDWVGDSYCELFSCFVDCLVLFVAEFFSSSFFCLLLLWIFMIWFV